MLVRLREGRHKVVFAFSMMGIIVISSLAVLYPTAFRGVQPSPFAGSLPPVFPRSNSPGQLYVVDVSENAQFSYELAALQGLAARTKPSLFLVTRPDDMFWLRYTTSVYGLTYQNISAADALLRFKNYIEDPAQNVKLVVYDANDSIFPTELNMARTLAGVYSALPVSSNDLATIESIFLPAPTVVVKDLRGQFSDKVSAYSWLWNEVGNNVTKKFVVLSPDGRLGLTDYLVEFKSFVFEFNATGKLTQNQSIAASNILSAFGPMTPVLGFFGLGGEVPTVSFPSQRQMMMFPAEEVADLSMYSGLPEAINLQPSQGSAVPAFNASKTYILFSFSQGDALGFDFYTNKQLWSATDPVGHPYRSEIPEAWQVNPVAAELAPQILEYYYQTMSANDSFYPGASGGAGYVHPDELPDLTSYLQLSKAFDVNIGLNIYYFITAQKDLWQPDLYTEYATEVSPEGIFLKEPMGHPAAIVSSLPVIPITYEAPASFTFSSSDVTTMAIAIRQLSRSDRFIFVFMPSKNPGLPFVSDLLAELGPNYVPLTADQFVRLYSQVGSPN